MKIEINNLIWEIVIAPSTNPELIANGEAVAGATWPMQQKIYLSSDLTKDTVRSVIAHELTHAFLFSTQIKPVADAEEERYSEEEMCNFVSLYGDQIFTVTARVYNELYF